MKEVSKFDITDELSVFRSPISLQIKINDLVEAVEELQKWKEDCDKFISLGGVLTGKPEKFYTITELREKLKEWEIPGLIYSVPSERTLAFIEWLEANN